MTEAPLYDQIAVRLALKRRLRADGLDTVAAHARTSAPALEEMVDGRRSIGARLARLLGFRRVERFVRTEEGKPPS